MKQTPTKKQAQAPLKKTGNAQPLSTPRESPTGLLELFTDGIKDMYWAEIHLVKSIPKMVSAASDNGLKNTLAQHLEITIEHVARLENIFEILGEKIVAKKCDACEGLVMSGEHVIENTIAGTEARNTGIIMSALKVENFEITAYKGLIQLANTLGLADAASILEENLAEEVEADALLNDLNTNENANANKGNKAKSFSKKQL